MWLSTSKIVTFACVVYFVQLPVMEGKSLQFERFECEVLDKDFCIFKKCGLEKTSEGIVVINVHLQPLQPLENITVKINLLRKNQESYRQFYYESLVDFCDFLKNYKRYIPWGLMYQSMSKYTNVNHSCPYNHDLILKNAGILLPSFEAVPMPKGEYLLKVMVMWNKVQKIKFRIFAVRK